MQAYIGAGRRENWGGRANGGQAQPAWECHMWPPHQRRRLVVQGDVCGTQVKACWAVAASRGHGCLGGRSAGASLLSLIRKQWLLPLTCRWPTRACRSGSRLLLCSSKGWKGAEGLVGMVHRKA